IPESVKMRVVQSLLPVLLVALLSACATSRVPPQSAERLWEQRRPVLAELRSWQFKARIGIVTEDDSGSASLRWQQRGNEYSLKITAPFGRGLLAIEGSDAGVIMRDGDGRTASAASPEALIWQQTGWYIPVSELRYWIVGLPAD